MIKNIEIKNITLLLSETGDWTGGMFIGKYC